MKTKVYQSFVSKYAEIFTLIEMQEGIGFHEIEIIPSSKVSKLSKEELEELVNELMDYENEKASWIDGVEEDE